MSNYTDSLGHMLTQNTPTVQQIQQRYGLSSNDAEAVRKAAGK